MLGVRRVIHVPRCRGRARAAWGLDLIMALMLMLVLMLAAVVSVVPIRTVTAVIATVASALALPSRLIPWRLALWMTVTVRPLPVPRFPLRVVIFGQILGLGRPRWAGVLRVVRVGGVRAMLAVMLVMALTRPVLPMFPMLSVLSM